MRSFRKERVGSAIQAIVSEVVLHRLSDPRIHAMTTITRVVVTGDLLLATVFVGVPGGDVEERKTLQALQHAAGYVQRIVAHELNIRQCPEIRFEIDEAVKDVRRILELLDRNRKLHPEWAAQESETEEASTPRGQDEPRSAEPHDPKV